MSFRIRLCGGPHSGLRLTMDIPPEFIEIGHGEAAESYFTVRMRGRRLLALHAPLARRLPPARNAGPRNPRRQIAAWIVLHHGLYKVCRGCDSIVMAGAHNFCPHCHSYGFEEGPAAVQSACRALANGPPLWLHAAP